MTSDFVTKGELNEALGELEIRIMDFLKQVLSAAGELKIVSEIEGDVPPSPPRVSRRFAGSKGDLRARIDRVLFDLLEKDAQEQSGGNVSRQLDIILWRYYGKPKLSWETEENE